MAGAGTAGKRIAIVSDIHGNRTAFEAVLGDLKRVSPDVVYHGGDLADSGSSPVEIVDQIRELGWQGVLGNTDEMLVRPESLAEFAARSPHLASMFAAIEEIAAATRELLGQARLQWLGRLSRQLIDEPIALVHASPESAWQAPGPEANDSDFMRVYRSLGQPIVVYGHLHRSFVRTLPGMVVINTGSVSLSHDGDCRAAYLLLDRSRPEIRRVEYDVEKEAKVLARTGLPHCDWIARILRSGRPELP